ncbi:hypothetical protein OSSY52_19000 [Tepiditoga spiralis]|uniref:DarT domain-containing protein n=1 Tax=Tepiditoga spiralis TaxID=2108365 RepID=A0A7G1GC50_9BACT|nr:DarT ssDNA thymidine ADP-ribosyltransferase family protein [Tepiditoga spiralis]BBE31759.1 hypothetical protein OSSY52_19000 [Tepiditoga spiralis]
MSNWYNNEYYYVKKLYNIIMKKKGYILHVTEYENLKSIIKEKGIYSVNNLKWKKIYPKYITDNLSKKLDKKNNTNDYVKVAFDESYNMFSAKIYYKKLKNPVIIKIDPIILLEKSFKLSNTNSTSNYAKIGNCSEILDLLDFDIIYERYGIREKNKNYIKSKKQAEILIKDKVDYKYIKEIILPYEKDNIKSFNIKLKKANIYNLLNV